MCLACRQRPTNISIKIDTTKEFVTDSDQGHDTEKVESALVSIINACLMTNKTLMVG